AAMLLTVAAAFPLTNRVFGIYIRRSGPRKTRSKYQSPATRPGLLIILVRIEALRVEVMVTSVVGDSRLWTIGWRVALMFVASLAKRFCCSNSSALNRPSISSQSHGCKQECRCDY